MGNLKDFAVSTVTQTPVPLSSGLSLSVQAGHGVRFPNAPFHLTACPANEYPTLDNAEKLLVTAKSGDVFTIERSHGDTTAKNISQGWIVANTVFLADLDELVQVVDNLDSTETDQPLSANQGRELSNSIQENADNHFEQAFTNVSSVVVAHNLGKIPSVMCIDSAGDQIVGSINHSSVNELTVHFSSSTSGTIYLN